MRRATLIAALLLLPLAGCISTDSGTDPAGLSGPDGPDQHDGAAEDGHDAFEAQEPSGTCGDFDSLEPVAPTHADPAGLVTGWDLLELDIVMIADPAFQENHTDDWQALLQDLVDDANVHYEEQVGIRWNVTLIAGLPPDSLVPGRDDGRQRDVARGYMDAHHPDLDRDIVAVILGADYEGSVAGQVECVHGLAYKDYAYLWSEYDGDRDAGEFMDALGVFEDKPLKVFMHEVAHLLAAHHHYTQCGIAILDYGTHDSLALCGTMINDIGLASYTFSVTNRLVMRSFVEELGVGEPVPA